LTQFFFVLIIGYVERQALIKEFIAAAGKAKVIVERNHQP